jgi:hypothetical protein
LGENINKKSARKENDEGYNNPEIGGRIEKKAVWRFNFFK